ncbi:MAG: MBL fold metallo-hydrolase [Sarcina sp.]
MIIKTIPTGAYEANTYVVMDEDSKEGIIIDNFGEFQKIDKVIKELSMIPKAILLTHGHFDHVSGVNKLKEEYKIPVYINENDWNMIDKKADIFGEMEKPEFFVKEGDEITLGNKIIKVIETPGHTPGGVCFLIEDHLFTGDTLFKQSIGRTDFVGGDSKLLLESVNNKLAKLDDNIKVYPGHGMSSTIGFEKVANPYIAGVGYVY